MSFLNRSILQERAAAATVEKHPLLKECDVPPNVKQAYLQGCVLAVLERDDGKVTDAARQEIIQLGLSLEFAESDIDEAIGVVSGLASTEDQSEFLKELTVTLSTGVYPRFFMADFERLIKKDGVLSADAEQTVDYIGRTLTQNVSWRISLRAREGNNWAVEDFSARELPLPGERYLERGGILNQSRSGPVASMRDHDVDSNKDYESNGGVGACDLREARGILLSILRLRGRDVGSNALRGKELVQQGHAYLNGDGVPFDQKKAFVAFERAAKMGDAEGLNMLGMCYLNGWGVDVNERKAFQYCRKSADVGFAYAQYNLGSFYQNGQGCSVDNSAAVKMYRAAAAQGMPDAQNALGMCYLNGLGVKNKNFVEAVFWCRRAANQDHPIAAWNMATFYMNGQGVPQDEEQARKWLQKSAFLGNEEAKKALQEWDAQFPQSASRVPQRGVVEKFWHENGDSITSGLKVAGRLLLRDLFGG